MSDQSTTRLITTKEAEAEIPALENQVGNHLILDLKWTPLARPKIDDSSLLSR